MNGGEESVASGAGCGPERAIRVGILWQRGGEWHGGGIYRENLARILREHPETVPVVVLRFEEEIEALDEEFAGFERVVIGPILKRLAAESETAGAVERAPGSGFWDRWGRKGKRRAESAPPPERPGLKQALIRLSEEHGIDLFFPLPPTLFSGVPGLGWIPDFQHRFLPENFSNQDRREREERFGQIAKMRAVLLSSEDCLSHFREIYPDSPASVSVWRFCSRLKVASLGPDPESVRQAYHLPDEFFVVANQFWKHKDHEVVLKAMEILRDEGNPPEIVFTGALRDHRGTAHVDRFLQTAQKLGLHAKVRVLGFLPRGDQLALMRRALAVIQPSRFEGWSTVVEDCRALGQRVVMSDLKVHLEQDPPHGSYFALGDPDSLAKAIRAIQAEAPGSWEGDRFVREERAAENMERVETGAADSFVAILRSAVAGRGSRGAAEAS